MKLKRIVAGLAISLLMVVQIIQPDMVFAVVNASQRDADIVAVNDEHQTTSPADNPKGVNDHGHATTDTSAKGAQKPSLQNNTDQVASLSSIEYVYVHQQIVAVGETQHIVLGFTGLSGNVISSDIELTDSAGRTTTVASESIADNAALYSIKFNDSSQARSYTVSKAFYKLSDSVRRYAVDLSGDTDRDNTYAFDVVSADTAEALGKSKDNDGVTAIVIKDDGSLEAADSVDDAISKADRKGVKKSADEASAPEDTGKLLHASAPSTREDYLIVAIDPGHGGTDSGACYNGLKESDMNLSIAQHFRDELQTYTGVSAYLTRTSNTYVSLEQRVNDAVRVGSDVFVSVHCNSASDPSARGSEIWVPNNSSFNHKVHDDGNALGQKILAQLEKLGLHGRGVKDKDYGGGSSGAYYPDGSRADYYSVIRNARKAGIPGIIVEHAFLSNSGDATFMKDDSNRAKLGAADATGVAQQYNLGKDGAARAQSLVGVTSHISGLGWEGTVYDHKVSGTTGKSKNLEAIRVSLQGAAARSGGIEYRSHISDIGWESGWKENGTQSGTTGQSKSVEAVQMKLTGGAAGAYDIYYRVHSAEFGWLDWAKDGQYAGSEGYGRASQAIEVVIVNKGAKAPGSTSCPFKRKADEPTSIAYRAHVRNIGWQGWVRDSNTAGTTGRNLPIEALQVNAENAKGVPGSVSVQSHVESIGWQPAVSGGAVSGTTGKTLRTEAIRIQLTGQLQNQFDVYYRVHSAGFGWLGWAKNNEKAGSEGYGRGAEAIQIQLVKKGKDGPASQDPAFHVALISYRSHVETIGWQGMFADGAVAGTTGRSLRLEALSASLCTAAGSGGVEVRAHVSDIGWQPWRTDGAVAGTTGQSKAIEAVQIKLSGVAAQKYDIYYQVHSSDLGWLDWAKNGERAGSQGLSRAAEAIRIQLVKKGGPAPGKTTKPFIENGGGSIMGNSSTTAAQMTRFYRSKKGNLYPSSTYSSKGAADIDAFCRIIDEESRTEGVRAEVVFSQSMQETGWLRFGGSVKKEQCNFGGLGATDSRTGGATFNTVRDGIRAQVQHLKAYASTEPLKNVCVDPRFRFIKRGSAPMLYDLNGKWAVPGTNYGQSIRHLIEQLLLY